MVHAVIQVIGSVYLFHVVSYLKMHTDYRDHLALSNFFLLDVCLTCAHWAFLSKVKLVGLYFSKGALSFKLAVNFLIFLKPSMTYSKTKQIEDSLQ